MKPDKQTPSLRIQFQLYMNSIMIDYHHRPSTLSIKRAAKAVLHHEKEAAKRK